MDEINPYQPPRTESRAAEPADELYNIACHAAAGTPYPPAAFVFLVHGFEFAEQHIRHERKRRKHIDAVDVCWCLHDLAVYRFGEDARDQLAAWNLRSTRDFGEMVYRMIEIGQMRNEEGETIEEFDDVFDFSGSFDAQKFKSTLLIDEDQ